MKTLRCRLGCLLLSAVLLLSTISAAFAAPTPGLSNFKRVNTYTAGTFSDVPEGEWYTPSIKAAYEYGLAMGAYGKFDRTSNMTAATAITLAARLHAIYHTGSTAALVQGDPWYQVYVDYALTNGIIEAGQFANYDKTDATRAQCAVMLSKAIPADELPTINTVEDGAIPDLSADSPYYEDIYALYRAGILTGNDDKGTFTPDKPIDRTAFFTIATRIVDKTLRRSITLTAPLDTENPIVIGHLADLTGNQSLTGLWGKQAVDLAVKLINKDGGIAGRAVKVIAVDCQSSFTEAKNATQELIENEKVLAILSPSRSNIAVGRAVSDFGVPTLFYNATPFGMTKLCPYLFSADGSTGSSSMAMASYIYNVMGWRTVHTVAPNTADGLNTMNPFIDNFTALGGKVIRSAWIDSNTSDYAPWLATMTPDADGIAAWFPESDALNFWTTWYDAGLDLFLPTVAVSHSGFTDSHIWDALNADRPDVVDAILQQGVYTPVSWIRSLDNEANRTLLAAWEAEYGETAPDCGLPGTSYTTMLLLKDAIESIEGEVTRDTLYTALQSTCCDGPEGSVFFADSKLTTKDIHIGKVVQSPDGTFSYQKLLTYETVPPQTSVPFFPIGSVEPADPSTPVEPDAPTQPENPIVIGHLAHLTGVEGYTGRMSQQAVDFAAAQLNAKGGIGGQPVKVVHYDCQSSPQKAASGVKQLVEQEGANVLLVSADASLKKAAAEAAAACGVPVLSGDQTPTELTDTCGNLVSVGGGTLQMPTVMADYLYGSGLRKVYCIAQDSALGRAYMEPFIYNFESLGGTVIEAMWVDSSAMDISRYLIGVREEADAIVGWLPGTQGINLWSSWYYMALSDTMPLYAATHTGFTDEFIWNSLNNVSPEVIAAAMQWGVFTPVHWAYSVEGEINRAFVENWQAEFGASPEAYGLAGRTYTALLLLKNAVESVAGELTGEAILAALQTAACNGPDGATAFDGSNVPTKDLYIAKVTQLADGSFNYNTVRTYTDVPPTGLYVEGGALDSMNCAKPNPYTPVSLLFNAGADSVCQNADLRKAICYVIDNAGVAAALTSQGKQAVPIYGFQPYVSDAPSAWAAGRPYYAYNANRVRSHLNQAGYNGEKITLLCPAELGTAAKAVCDMLLTCGINCQVELLDKASYRLVSADPGAWDMRLDTVADGSNLPEVFQTLHAAEAGGQNAFMTADPELDAMLAQWQADPTNTALQQIYDNRFTFEQCYGYGIYGYPPSEP